MSFLERDCKRGRKRGGEGRCCGDGINGFLAGGLAILKANPEAAEHPGLFSFWVQVLALWGVRLISHSCLGNSEGN